MFPAALPRQRLFSTSFTTTTTTITTAFTGRRAIATASTSIPSLPSLRQVTGARSLRCHIPRSAITRFERRVRDMSTSASTEKKELHEWLVILPDCEGALDKRLAVRETHLAGAKQLHESGFFTFGGGYLDEPMVEGQKPTFKGSAMLCLGESKEEVLKVLREDPYTKNGVWDWEKVQIYAFKAAIRAPYKAE